MPHSDSGTPLVKRQKRSAAPAPAATAKAPPSASAGSTIFAPFRTVGLVSPTDVPFTAIPVGKTTFQVTTSAGRCLQTYDLKRGLNLVFVTRPQTPHAITATCAWKQKVLAAWGRGGGDDRGDSRGDDRGDEQGVWIFQRGRKVGELPVPADLDEPIRQLLVFGAWIVGLARTRVEVWTTASLEHYTTLQPTATTPGSNELTGGMCTMPTFLNKLLVGRADGWVELWNVSSGKLVYTILPPAGLSARGAAVTCLEPTPALGLLAIAYAAGPLVVHDIVRDVPLLCVDAGTAGNVFDAEHGGDGDDDDENTAPVTSISFRTDGRGAGPDGRSEGVMATATTANGDVTFWDLNHGGRIMGVLRSAHNPPGAAVSTAIEGPNSSSSSSSSSGLAAAAVRGGISRVAFLPGQPVLLTSGRDNALRSWIFDETPFSPIPRILHARSGHAAPVGCLAFLPSDFDGPDAGSKWLLSGGLDRSLWGWSLRRDGQSTELSQGHVRQRARKTGVLASSAAVLLHKSGGGGGGPSTTLADLKAPPITAVAASLNRDGGIGALPGKLPVWLRVEHPDRRKKKGGSSRGDGALRPGDTESSSATGWESVVTAHAGDAWARTWFWGRKRAGRWMLPTADGKPVSAVAVSACGSFALVGSAGGTIDVYNLQSGIHRQRFPARLTPAQARQLQVQQQLRQSALGSGSGSGSAGGSAAGRFKSPGAGRHTQAVTGLVVDSLNSCVVSCSLDGTVKFWDFLTGHLVDEIRGWGGGGAAAAAAIAITACRFHAANDLLAFAGAVRAIRVVDLATHKTIRVFRTAPAPASAPVPPGGDAGGCRSDINDLCFSSDGRWIVAVTQSDARLRVWDLATSHLIDSVVLDRPGRAVAVSGSGEFLAVAPDGDLGVHLWTNKTLFRHVPTRPVVEAAAPAAAPAAAVVAGVAPTASGEGGAGLVDAAFDDENTPAVDDDDDADDIVPARVLDQLSADMTTLSLVPKARWQTLLHLDLIKQRNRPREPPKAPEKAPFFLGTVGSADAEAAGLLAAGGGPAGSAGAGAAPGTVAAPDAVRSRILTFDHTRAQQTFTRLLHADDFTPFVDHLKGLPPAQADLELRSLAPEQGELALFVRAMTSRLRARRDYELVQAWMAVFLRLHGSTVVEMAADADGDGSTASSDIAAALAEWRAVQEHERSRLDALVGYCGGVVSFLRSPRS